MWVNKISPNHLCSCGSGKKYKKCYWLADPYQNTCAVFLKENIEKNLKHTQEFIDDAVKEISSSILLLHNSETQSLRSQTIILCAFGETMAKIRSCFLYGKPLEQDKQVFTEWFDKFVCVDINKSWKEHDNLKALDWDIFYRLRCSLSHKLSIPNLSYHWKNIMINSNSKNENAQKLRQWIKWTIIFSPLEISKAIFEATTLMIDEINIRKDEIDFSKKLQDLANYLYKEWAVLIKVEPSI